MKRIPGPTRARAVVAGAALALGGCSTLVDHSGAVDFVRAEPVVIDDTALGLSGAPAREAVAKAVRTSLDHCGVFTSRVFLGEGVANTSGDTAVAGLTAAATVTTPVGATHVLTAIATLFGAGQASFNKEFFAKATAATLQTAITSTYYREMSSYINDVAALDDSHVQTAQLLPALQMIHAKCALGPAQSVVAATVQAAAASAAGGSDTSGSAGGAPPMAHPASSAGAPPVPPVPPVPSVAPIAPAAPLAQPPAYRIHVAPPGSPIG